MTLPPGRAPTVGETIMWLEDRRRNCARIARGLPPEEEEGWAESYRYLSRAGRLLRRAYPPAEGVAALEDVIQRPRIGTEDA